MSAFFRGITETVPSLFRGIFSERNSVPNPMRGYKACLPNMGPTNGQTDRLTDEQTDTPDVSRSGAGKKRTRLSCILQGGLPPPHPTSSHCKNQQAKTEAFQHINLFT